MCPKYFSTETYIFNSNVKKCKLTIKINAKNLEYIYISYDANGGRTYGRSKIMYNIFTSIHKNEYTSNNAF